MLSVEDDSCFCTIRRTKVHEMRAPSHAAAKHNACSTVERCEKKCPLCLIGFEHSWLHTYNSQKHLDGFLSPSFCGTGNTYHDYWSPGIYRRGRHEASGRFNYFVGLVVLLITKIVPVDRTKSLNPWRKTISASFPLNCCTYSTHDPFTCNRTRDEPNTTKCLAS